MCVWIVWILWQTPQRLFEWNVDIIYLKDIVKDKDKTACIHNDIQTHGSCVYKDTQFTHTYPSTHRHTHNDTLTPNFSPCVINLPKARRRGRKFPKVLWGQWTRPGVYKSGVDRRMGSTTPISLLLVPHKSLLAPAFPPLPPSSNLCCHFSQVY